MATSAISFENSYSGYSYTPAASAASGNPADLAISQGMESQVRGYDQGTRNAQAGQDVLQTADGALSNISDSLQRMRELAVKASSSAIYSDSDRAMFQEEIDQLKEHITGIARNTQFNQKNLLDGSMADMYLAVNPSGGGMSIRTTDATLDALGIRDFDVSGGVFDIEDLDQAIQRVSDARSSLGAQSSALNHTMSANRVASYNNTNSMSKLEDTDIPGWVNEQKKGQIMQQYQYFVQNQISFQQENMVNMLLR